VVPVVDELTGACLRQAVLPNARLRGCPSRTLRRSNGGWEGTEERRKRREEEGNRVCDESEGERATVRGEFVGGTIFHLRRALDVLK